jgi:hypothetical protein
VLLLGTYRCWNRSSCKETGPDKEYEANQAKKCNKQAPSRVSSVNCGSWVSHIPVPHSGCGCNSVSSSPHPP